MQWITEMFAAMQREKTAELMRRGGTKAIRPKRLKSKIPGAEDVWNGLISTLSNDVTEFNNHKERSGQTAVHIAHTGFRCEVYLPGLSSKRMVLTLDNSDLQVSVHPDFPKQQFPITMEVDPDGQHAAWVLGENAKEGAKLTVQQLSEYLLKPVLCLAAIHA